MNWSLILNFLAAMLAIVNPLGLVPIWQELTGDAKPEVRKKIAFLVTLVSLAILLIFLNTGHYLLTFFSIDLAVFKIAGGILLLLTAISMIQGSASKLEERDEKADTSFELAKKRFRKILVPLAVPMLCGPGSITTVLLYSFKAGSIMDYVGLSVILILNFIALLAVMGYSYKVENRVDELFFVGFTRIFGVMVAAIAVQFMVEGLGEVFPNWIEGPSPIENSSIQENQQEKN